MLSKIHTTIMLGFSCILLSACAKILDVNYTCTPIGADLVEIETGKSLGSCPTHITYNIPSNVNKNSFFKINGITATWASGTSVSTDETISVDLSQGRYQAYNFARPKNVAGYQADSEYALQLRQQALAAQANNQAAQQAQNLVLLQMSRDMVSPPRPAPTYSGPTHCTTIYTGGPMVNTNCY